MNKVTNYRQSILVRNLDTFARLQRAIVTLAGNLTAWENATEGTQVAKDLAPRLFGWEPAEVVVLLHDVQIMTQEAENDLADLERNRDKE